VRWPRRRRPPPPERWTLEQILAQRAELQERYRVVTAANILDHSQTMHGVGDIVGHVSAELMLEMHTVGHQEAAARSGGEERWLGHTHEGTRP
jgi:hypothetical protein